MSAAADPLAEYHALLIEQVAVPEFYAKVAGETGLRIQDPAAATELRLLGDRATAAVAMYQEKVAAARRLTADDLVKGAAAAARELATGPAPTPVASAPGDYLTQTAVLEAATKIAAAKAATGLSGGMMPPPAGPSVADVEDEEDEDGKK